MVQLQVTFAVHDRAPGREGSLWTCVAEGVTEGHAINDAWAQLRVAHPHRRAELVDIDVPGALPRL